jgi:acyl dehydratase
VRYFEDMQVGQHFELGSATFSEAEIVGFGTRYDPQPFHTDPAAALSSSFGGLVASGAQTFSSFIRLFVEEVLLDAASAGSPGVDELRWHRPVRPGDVLTCSYTVLSARPSRSRPNWGVVTGLGEGFNQRGDRALSMKLINLLTRNATEGAS